MDDLKQRLQREHDGHKKRPLQMLYPWRARMRARQGVARLLGVHRNTISRWLGCDETGGLDALVAIYMPSGKPLSISSDVLATLERAVRRPDGFASYHALRAWLRQTHQIEIKHKTLYTLLRRRFGAKLKVPQPSHTKNPDAIAAFHASCRDQLQKLIPSANTRPVRVFSQDESRFGLLTVRRRRLTGRGVQPIGTIQYTFEWFYIYGAVAPTSGETFFLELPQLNADNFQLFLDGLAHAFPDSLNLLVLDKSAAHTAVPNLWAAVCERTAPATCKDRRQMAS